MKCQATFKNHCQYPKCDCDRPDGWEEHFAPDTTPYITDPSHGGKVTCHKCNGFIAEGDDVPYWDHQHRNDFPRVHFHKHCFNRYQHYYGLDRPLD